MRNVLRLFFVIICCCNIAAIADQTNSLDISDIEHKIITDKFHYSFEQRESPAAMLKFFQNNKGIPLSYAYLNLGYDNPSAWFYLKVNSDRSVKKVLLYEAALIETGDFFWYRDGQLVRQSQQGELHNRQNRFLGHRNMVFPITVDAGHDYELLIHIKNTLDIRFKAVLQTEDYFIKNQQLKNIGFGIYFGLLAMLIIYNLIRWVASKDFYLFYVAAYIFSGLLYVVNLYGFSYAFVGSSYAWLWYYVDIFSMYSVTVLATIIFYIFLRRINLFRIGQYIFKYIGVALLLLLMITLLSGKQSLDLFAKSLLYIAVPVSFFGFLYSVGLLSVRHLQVQMFAFSWIIVLVSGFLNVVSVLIGVNSPLASGDFFLVGFLLQSLMMTVLTSIAISEAASMRLKAIMESRAKSDFLANISHQIRTPINGVSGAINLLLMDKSLDNKQRRYVESMRASKDSLLLLVNELLDYSALDIDGIKIHNHPFKLQDSIRRLKGIFVGMQRSGVNDLLIDIDKNMSDCFVGDQSRIEQVLINFISNAYKYSGAGIIRLKINEVEGGSGHYYFAVEDNGVGISSDQQRDLFSAFKKQDKRAAGDSTGLGLSISKQMVELMGGSIGVNSELGKGATFWFVIPLRPCDNTEFCERVPSLPNLPEQRKSTAILVAEDNPTNQQIIKAQLQRLGHQCYLVNDGDAAVDFLANNDVAIDLVIMDYEMPRMNGIDACRAIRALNNDHAVVPVVALTAHATPHKRQQCLQAGMMDYLEKPLDLQRLKNLLNKLP